MITSTSFPTKTTDIRTSTAFDDPVAYLASFGIDAEVVDQTALPAAA